MKRKNKHCIERKKGCSGRNRMILIHSNVSNITSFVYKQVLKKTTRCSVLQTDLVWIRTATVWMRSFF